MSLKSVISVDDIVVISLSTSFQGNGANFTLFILFWWFLSVYTDWLNGNRLNSSQSVKQKPLNCAFSKLQLSILICIHYDGSIGIQITGSPIEMLFWIGEFNFDTKISFPEWVKRYTVSLRLFNWHFWNHCVSSYFE